MILLKLYSGWSCTYCNLTPCGQNMGTDVVLYRWKRAQQSRAWLLCRRQLELLPLLLIWCGINPKWFILLLAFSCFDQGNCWLVSKLKGNSLVDWGFYNPHAGNIWSSSVWGRVLLSKLGLAFSAIWNQPAPSSSVSRERISLGNVSTEEHWRLAACTGAEQLERSSILTIN